MKQRTKSGSALQIEENTELYNHYFYDSHNFKYCSESKSFKITPKEGMEPSHKKVWKQDGKGNLEGSKYWGKLPKEIEKLNTFRVDQVKP